MINLLKNLKAKYPNFQKYFNSKTPQFRKFSRYVFIFGAACGLTLPFTMYLMDVASNEVG